MRKVAKDELDADLPEEGRFGAGVVFLAKMMINVLSVKQPSSRSLQNKGRYSSAGVRFQPIQPEPTSVPRLCQQCPFLSI